MGLLACSSPAPAAPSAAPGLPAGCRESTAPACGPFRWEPSPAPDALATGSVTASPPDPATGTPVTFVVTFSDPDAVGVWCEPEEDFGDGTRVSRVCDPPPCPWHGPRSPPPRQPGAHTYRFVHVYAQRGRYSATFDVLTSSPGAERSCYDPASGRSGDPYGSSASVTITVNVR